MIQSSSLNECRDYVGNWSHLEAAEKVCTEDSTQPWSGKRGLEHGVQEEAHDLVDFFASMKGISAINTDSFLSLV